MQLLGPQLTMGAEWHMPTFLVMPTLYKRSCDVEIVIFVQGFGRSERSLQMNPAKFCLSGLLSLLSLAIDGNRHETPTQSSALIALEIQFFNLYIFVMILPSP